METPYLIRDPEEISLPTEQEKEFIKRRMEADRELLLITRVDGKHVGNCPQSRLGNYNRYSHRCSITVALYQKYCGMGIGKTMLEMVLETARQCEYEQAELKVVKTNTTAFKLYESLGFEIYGEQPHSMKYKDGTYADEFLMVNRLDRK